VVNALVHSTLLGVILVLVAAGTATCRELLRAGRPGVPIARALTGVAWLSGGILAVLVIARFVVLAVPGQ